MKKAMVIVPHPDDELLVGGGILYALAHDKTWEVKVVYSTNGDYYAHEGEIRLKEAIQANKCLGVPEKNIIFLGYGDGWRGNHIYNSSGICKSMAGKTQTYALGSHPEFCYKKCGVHHEYTRENLKCDMESVIQDDFPELIICVDFDSAPDHRAVSLLFTEVIRKILINNVLYHPLILKKLAYENVMRGEKDYFKLPHQRTHNPNNKLESTPILKWSDRLSFETPFLCNGLRLTKNPLYLAACCHASQNIQYKMIGAINSDVVYWRLPSENLALTATLQVSSGKAFYLNDLKTIDSMDINEEHCALDASVWIPDENDIQKRVKFEWKAAQRISKILFFENPDQQCNIYEISYKFDNMDAHSFTDIMHDGSASILEFKIPVVSTSLEIIILAGTRFAGLSEISIYDAVPSIDQYLLPCKLLNEKTNQGISLNDKIISWYDFWIYSCKSTLRKIWATKYTLMKHYPKAIYRKYFIPLYRIHFWLCRCYLLAKKLNLRKVCK